MSGKRRRMRASYVQAERMPVVGTAVLSGGRSVASTTAPPAPTTGLCHVLLKLLETIEKRKVLAPKPQSILQWVVRNIIGMSKGEKHETSTHI